MNRERKGDERKAGERVKRRNVEMPWWSRQVKIVVKRMEGGEYIKEAVKEGKVRKK